MFFYVYVLHSERTKGLYIGFTDNLPRRLKEHNKKESRSTSSQAPWEVIYFEGHKNKADAIRREKYLKTSQGAWTIKRVSREYLKEK